MTEGGQFKLVGISEGLLAIDYQTETGLSGRYVIDVESLDHVDRDVSFIPQFPSGFKEEFNTNKEMNLHIINDQSGPQTDGSRYYLIYETMQGGFRQHRPEVIPEGPLSPLTLIQIRENQ